MCTIKTPGAYKDLVPPVFGQAVSTERDGVLEHVFIARFLW